MGKTIILSENVILHEDPHCGDNDIEMNNRIANVGFVAYQRAKKKGVPVARYDASKRSIYLLHPDGSREYVK